MNVSFVQRCEVSGRAGCDFSGKGRGMADPPVRVLAPARDHHAGTVAVHAVQRREQRNYDVGDQGINQFGCVR
jgi:hypothetical protein